MIRARSGHPLDTLLLRVWLIVMFAGAGGIVVGSLATARIVGAAQDAPVLAASPAPATPRVAARQARDWLQSTVTRGRWMTFADPAFHTENVLRPGKGYDAMKPGVAMAANRGHRAGAERAQL
jgi:hypothetical protein